MPIDAPGADDHCGACRACINVCPTGAIVAPGRLDARRCISYLTIEHRGAIPVELRSPIGNRIFGCDDCQLVCPWNRYAKASHERDFGVRSALDRSSLIDLFEWNEATFLARTEGSALRRIHHRQWLRNLAVALGNAPYDTKIVAALELKRAALDPAGDAMLIEHIDWALARQRAGAGESTATVKGG